MTVGEFIRKLKEAVAENGYTCNNVTIEDIIIANPSCIEVLIEDNKENQVLLYVEQD